MTKKSAPHIVIPACFRRGSKAETLIDIPNIFRTFPNTAEPFSNTFRSKNLSYIVKNTLCHSEQVSEANAVKGYPPGHPCQWQRNLHCELLKMFWKTKAVSTDMDPSLRSGWQNRKDNKSEGIQFIFCHSEQVSAANAVKGYPPGHPCQWQRNLHCELLKMFWKTKAVSTDMDPSLRSGWQNRKDNKSEGIQFIFCHSEQVSEANAVKNPCNLQRIY